MSIPASLSRLVPGVNRTFAYCGVYWVQKAALADY